MEQMNPASELSNREAAFFDDLWQQTKLERYPDPLVIPGIASLSGRRVLVCSCGTGMEPVMAANAGAEVFAFDISHEAVAKAIAVAEYNRVTINAEVMDFHALRYPSDYFDLIVGSSILHHVDCEKVGSEIYRCLKPNGVAYFIENSDRNPVLRWARRTMFGNPGGFQKRRFLFFGRHGTSDEYPLTEEEVAVLERIFDGHITRLYPNFVFFRMLAIHGWSNPTFTRVMRALDNFTSRLIPSVRKYSFAQNIWLQKLNL